MINYKLSGTTALIDADILIYSACFFKLDNKDSFDNNKLLSIRKSVVDSLVSNINNLLNPDHMLLFLSCSRVDNFRKRYNIDYKAGRPDKPEFFTEIKEYINTTYRAITVPTLEADDLIGIYANKENEYCEDAIICTIDKDLQQLEGEYFHLRKKEQWTISKIEANKNLFRQILTGDATDNIKGLYHIGVKKAEKYIEEHCKGDYSVKRLVEVTTQKYFEHLKDSGMDQETILNIYRCNANQIFILRKEGQSFDNWIMDQIQKEEN